MGPNPGPSPDPLGWVCPCGVSEPGGPTRSSQHACCRPVPTPDTWPFLFQTHEFGFSIAPSRSFIHSTNIGAPPTDYPPDRPPSGFKKYRQGPCFMGLTIQQEDR